MSKGAKKGKGRRKTGLLIILILVGIVVLTAFIFGIALGREGIEDVFRGGRQFNNLVLREARNVFELSTVEFIYRSVFPFDYLDDELSMEDIFRKLARERGTVDEVLSPEERAYFEAWNLAEDIDIGTGRNSRDFIVVTTVVRAGFDLGSEDFASVLNIETGVERQESGPPLRFAAISLPTAQVINVRVEDVNSGNYGYPDVEISPDEWRRVSNFVATQSVDRVVAMGLIEAAQRNGEDFLVRFLTRAGFDTVRIRP